MSDTVIVALVAALAAVIGGLITQLGEGIRQKRKRKYEKADGRDKDNQALKDGLKWVLYDRIRFPFF
jgi:membrane protein YqaA with SNARE-associated domain